MKSLQSRVLVIALLTLAAGVAAAQGLGAVVGFGTRGNGQEGAPFSADIVQEPTQVLADGNRIHTENHGKTFRDSEGRTRNENEMLRGSDTYLHITITDPVCRVFIILDPQAKTAIVNEFPKAPQPGTSAPFKPQVQAPRISMTTEKLDSKEIEGFTANGTRTTRTVAAGEQGNDKPLVSVNESWFSPDLKTTLLTVQDDPRSGNHTMRLTNIRLGDPDPLLFQVPSDYTVKETSHN